MAERSPRLLLIEGLELLEVRASAQQLEILNSFIEELLIWSQAFNLTSKASPSEIIREHILDSSFIADFLPKNGRFVDLGSGAGFPGIVIGAMCPSRKVVLVESRRKKANFLKAVLRKIKIDNIEVFEGRVESFAKATISGERFDVATTRATWGIHHFLVLSGPLLKNGGLAVTMQGPKVEIKGESSVENSFHADYQFDKVKKYYLPFTSKRRYLLTYKRCFT